MNRVRAAFSLRSVAVLALVAGILTALTLVLPGLARRTVNVRAASASATTQVTHVASASFSIYATSDARSFTVPEGTSSGALLFVYAGKTGVDAVSSASYGGQALTRLVARGQGSARIEVWYLLGPPAGTASFAWSKAGSSQNVTWGLSLFAGVDAATPFTDVVQNGVTDDRSGGVKSVSTANLSGWSVMFDAAVFNGSTVPAGGPKAAPPRSVLWSRNKSTTEGGAAIGSGFERAWTPSGLPHFDWAIVAFGLRSVEAAGGVPVNTALPLITVAPEGPGYVLSVTTGTWTNSPTSFSYAWGVVPDDVGPGGGGGGGPTLGSESTLHLHWPVGSGYYMVGVTATNAAGSGYAGAHVQLTPASFTVVALPSIFGTPRVGQTLTSNFGEYLGVPTGVPGWKNYNLGGTWLRCDTAGQNCIPVATSPTGFPQANLQYVVTAADVGATIRVLLVTTNLPGTTRPIGAASAPTAVVTP